MTRSALFKLVECAKKMISGEIGPIEGSRAIAHLRWDIGDGEDSVFDPFVGIASESDGIVVGDRSLWAQPFLDEVDRRYAAYDAALRANIAAYCQALLVVYEPKLRDCPACGFYPLEKPPYEATGEPSYEACPCCDFAPGLTEEIGYESAEWRTRWISRGMPFRRPPAPTGWDPRDQLRKAQLED